MNLKEWCYKYIETYKRYTLKPSTYDSYLSYCKHINIEKDIRDIKPFDIQGIINEMLSKRLALSTVKHTVIVMRLALDKAYKLGLIHDKSLFDDIELPKQKPRKVTALTDQEQDQLVLNRDKSHYGDFFLALLYSGLRVGELIALKWTNVDLINDVIYVEGTMYKHKINSPKTETSIRDVPIAEELKPILYRQRKNRNFVFVSTLGTPIVYTSVRDAWHRFCNTCGIYRPVGLHALRHTFATNAVAAGVNLKALSAILGHSSVAITLDIYTDVTFEDKKKAMRQISSTRYSPLTSSRGEPANFF